ncbi:hypothetical protein BHM03_00011629 [Ensete ventricosum]|nr:hypothetical protein BHM03_00011629 [Ensete ventricosum]
MLSVGSYIFISSLPYFRGANTVNDAIEFVLQNFTEMNKLWVRMQYQVRDPELRLGITLYGLQGPIGEKAKRGKERSELRDLVISLSRRKKREKNKREKKKREEPVPRVLLFPNSPV